MNEGGWNFGCESGPCANIDITETAYLDHQLTRSIQRTLNTTAETIIEGLLNLHKSEESIDWIPKFLATYILLRHWEMLCQQQHAIALERKVDVSDAIECMFCTRQMLTALATILKRYSFPRYLFQRC